MRSKEDGERARPLPPARGLLYVATAGALALAVRQLFFSPVPPWLAFTALGGYFALVLAGVLVLRLGMFVDVAFRGPENSGAVALTFDDGPSPEHTPKVLDLLEAAGAKATFFVIGRKAEAHPELVREIARRGHAVGLHGYAHDRLFSLRSLSRVRKDLERGSRVLEAILGERPRLFRPPIGHSSPRLGRAVAELDLEVIGWSVRGLDGLASAKPERVAERATRGLRPGAVLLLHDAAERDDHEPAALAALPRILEAIREKELSAERVDVLLGLVPARRASRSARAAARRAAS